MTRTNLLTFTCIAAIAVTCLDGGSLLAQSPEIPPLPGPTITTEPPAENGPTATISFAGKARFEAKSAKGRFPLAGIRPNETAEIRLQFASDWANTSITVQALDGGKVSAKAKDAVIAADGTASFRFQAGAQPGLYRIVVIGAESTTTLKFWVADPENPKANPPVINPGK